MWISECAGLDDGDILPALIAASLILFPLPWITVTARSVAVRWILFFRGFLLAFREVTTHR
jgi:hypothetical protein